MSLRVAFILCVSFAVAFAQSPPPAPAIPDDVAIERDVQYSNVGQRLAMDILRPKAEPSEPRPAVVMIHGGGFRAGSRNSYLPAAIRLAQRGYLAATISYRLAPRHQFPAAVEDSKAAVRFLKANAKRYNIDIDHIGVMGGSAGGHLALMVGLAPDVAELEGSGPNLEFSS
ncbi:MAG TPA: alpha/beta hydrolase, partial [Bryobacteraceae bacterium]|nr:alpha/beta hydrolase [Bryobacteraceae bacterium]